jgi:hypothetical protein
MMVSNRKLFKADGEMTLANAADPLDLMSLDIGS